MAEKKVRVGVFGVGRGRMFAQQEKGEEESVERIYKPEFPQFHDLATRSGHGGGDFFMVYEFIRAIRTGEPPYLDVYTGLQMSVIGILAHRSALNNTATYDVPSFRDLRS